MPTAADAPSPPFRSEGGGTAEDESHRKEWTVWKLSQELHAAREREKSVAADVLKLMGALRRLKEECGGLHQENAALKSKLAAAEVAAGDTELGDTVVEVSEAINLLRSAADDRQLLREENFRLAQRVRELEAKARQGS
eukprot:Hpha_TRINITY_DN35793_c0_g1::TRINITY_DN35793_c0_g1_i1::g.139976::m.139976